jgi:hypothetical protein
MTRQAGFERWTVATLGAATVAAIVAPVAGRAHPWVGGLIALACLAIAPWAARALPDSLDGVVRRRPVVSVLWVVLAVIGVAQMGRLSVFMSDARQEWGATVPDPLSAHHQCMSAYVYAADLSRRNADNLYDANHYPIFDPPGPTCRLVPTAIKGLTPWIADAYEYPPPFLLLPRGALALTSSFDTIRAWWFVIQALVLIAAGLSLARWIGGTAGLTIGLLIPVVLASLETMFNFQFGQFHGMAMILAVGAMASFHGRRLAWGGALLAAAILAKIFPAILLVLLAARREWRALGWTAAFAVIYALAGLVAFGPKPYVAFVSYQLPRLVSGAAFRFTHLGQHETFLISRNFSVAALGEKLLLLGAPHAAIAAVGAVPWIFSLGLLVLVAWLARGERSRLAHAVVWVGLLDLAALRSPEAPSAYVLAPVLWLLVLLAPQVRGRRGIAAALVVAWVLVVGPPPLPDRVDLIVGLILQSFAVALCVSAALRPGRGSSSGDWTYINASPVAQH